MPGQNYTSLSAKLRAAGLAAETPCAVISRASSPQQRTHITTISELKSAPRLASPTLLVVGEVVRFANRHSFEDISSDHSLSGLSSNFPSATETAEEEHSREF
jgi:siroheme synthase